MDSDTISTAAPASGAVPITTLLRSVGLPAIGTHWIEQGGIFAGIGRGQDGAPDYALIIAADPRGRFEDREWGKYGQDVVSAGSLHAGPGNTKAMAEAGSALAKDILALDIGGHTDWYLPSQADMHLACANVRDQFEKGDWYWTSTQCSPYDAWVQDVEDGRSTIDLKDNEFRAVAVRRFVL
jgi:hypothetical protein